MTIVGVTNEPAAKIKNFINSKGIKYVIAIGGAREYQTRGIPHAWLVSPDKKIVWEGHPASIRDSLILEHLKNVRLGPTFELPKELKKAEFYLNKRKYSYGIRQLESYLRRKPEGDISDKAKEAIKKVKEYGKKQLKTADKLAKEREFVDAALLLVKIEKLFTGLDTGKEAKTKLYTLKKDKDCKAELAAYQLYAKANYYIDKKNYKRAFIYLRQILVSKSYENTKTRVKAEDKYKLIKARL